MSMFAKYYQTKSNDHDSENEIDQNEPVKCTCGWFCEYEESHVQYSKWEGCDYIKSKYDLSYDSDGDLIAKPKVKTNSVKQKKPVTSIVYIHVPFEFKEQAKQLGARWDGTKWYTLSNNKNRQKLVDIFHEDNFHGSSDFDVIMNNKIKTEKVRIAIEEAKHNEYMERYNDYKDDIIAMHGKWTDQNEKNFREWYYDNFDNSD